MLFTLLVAYTKCEIIARHVSLLKAKLAIALVRASVNLFVWILQLRRFLLLDTFLKDASRVLQLQGLIMRLVAWLLQQRWLCPVFAGFFLRS